MIYQKNTLWHSILLLILIFCTKASLAQEEDSIWVIQENETFYIAHHVSEGETIMMLASRYKVPAAPTARLNQLSYTDRLEESQLIKIPLSNNNFLPNYPEGDSKAIYYKVNENERLKNISKQFNVAQSLLEERNNLIVPEVTANQTLLIGWIKYDSNQFPLEHKKKKEEEIAQKEQAEKDKQAKTIDTVEYTSPLGNEFHLYNEGRELREAGASTTFFKTKAVKYTDDDAFALYSEVSRGTILSIYNPATRKVVYAKVIGPLPNTPKYQNVKMALSHNAARVLRAESDRIFVRMKY